MIFIIINYNKMNTFDKKILENYVYELAKKVISENSNLIENYAKKQRLTEAPESKEMDKVQDKKEKEPKDTKNMVNSLKSDVKKDEEGEGEHYKDTNSFKKLDGVITSRIKSDPKLSYAALAYAIYRNEGTLVPNIHEIPQKDRDALRSRFSQSLNHTQGKSFSAKELTMLAKLVQSS